MIEKIYYIYVIIKESKEPINSTDILEELESEYNIKINVKTLYSYIGYINEFSSLLFNKNLIKTITARGYQCKEDIFDDGQLQYMIDMVISNPNIGLEQGKDMINTIEALSNQNQLDRMNKQKDKNKELNFNIFTTLSTVIKAINNKQNLKFEYIDYKLSDQNKLIEVPKHLYEKRKGIYLVSPYKLILNKSKYYLIAYDPDDTLTKDHIKVFRLDRMRKVQTSKTNSKNVYRDLNIDYDFEEMSKNNINMYLDNHKETLEIRFKIGILKEVVETFDDYQIKKLQQPQNTYQAIIPEVSINNGLIGWILMLSDAIEVIRPEHLRTDIKEKVEKLNTKYKQA